MTFADDQDDDRLEEWVEDDGDVDDVWMMCPNCRTPVHEDTQQCPHCGDWIIPTDTPRHARRWIWAIAVGLLLLSLGVFTLR